ncbi:Coenzyme F420 hydrogenase/dehydrogenase, beta subunit C-terminal domain [Methanotrichaceae archaeon Mx]|uniref:Coenzyme F420 hydrogenase/dehydrogenase, beta subunit C-terminal domain n=2 Tax=Candidatus Methanocrinis natronophilus TaxID=3033396 RepID=A0ABT5X963_9EURY|nr:Coenzyme F420 hydrogenase/dehydrogenase, beta subunit C-terminal domain [Candidatus Methanocrinis natronophilus]
MERSAETAADLKADPQRGNAELLLSPIGELEKLVWQRYACSGCRACISICPAGALEYDIGQNHPHQILPCVDCRACLEVCPRLLANVRHLLSSQILGNYMVIMNARSKMDYARAQNGGATTALLTAALDEDLIDCALVMGLDPWSHEPYPRIVHDSKDLKKCAGSRYSSNAILEPMKDSIKNAKNIALVGTPCSVQAIGLMRESSNEFAARFAQRVRFVIGLFCFEAYEGTLIPEISRLLGTQPWYLHKMNIGEGKISVKLRDGSHRSISLRDLAEHVKPGCKGCEDFTAKLSDISIGSTGSAPGMSTVILRTPEGKGLFDIANEMGFLEVADGVDIEAIEKTGRLKLKKDGI